MSNKISEEDKKNFSKYVMYGDFDKAEQLLRKLAESVQFEDKDRSKVINEVSFEDAQKYLKFTMERDLGLEYSLMLIQGYPNLINETKKLIDETKKENLRKEFSEYMENSDWDKAEKFLRELAQSMKEKEIEQSLKDMSFDDAKEDFVRIIKSKHLGYLDICVKLLKLHPNLIEKSKEEIEAIMKRNQEERSKENFSRCIEHGNWEGAQSVLSHSIKSGLFKGEKSPLINEETLKEPQQSFIWSIILGDLVACINLLQHRSTLLFEVKEEIENVMKQNKERISANEDTRDSEEFSKYIKCGNWEKAKIILDHVAEQSSSEIERPYEQVKEDFAHGVKIRSLSVCASIMKRYPNIAVDVEEEIKNIMQKNKENNQLNVEDSHYQEEPKREVSNGLGNLNVSHPSDKLKR